jgi:uncharacterized protein
LPEVAPSGEAAGAPAGVVPGLAIGIPSVLLEEDQPAVMPSGGPGQRYALGPVAPAERVEHEGELPEAYGTQQLMLTARDPHWLYAHWDLTHEQLRHYNALSVDRHLIVRVYLEAIRAQPIAEIHVHPESRHWFVHVDQAGAKYMAELGYYCQDGQWGGIASSGATLTPPDTMSEETEVEFATIPFELPLARLVALAKEAAQETVPLAVALEEMRGRGHPELPAPPAPALAAAWTPAQDRALAEVISMDRVHRVWIGSMEITELLRHPFAWELASMAAAQFDVPTSPAGGPGPISSPPGGPPAGRGFQLDVNAELIVYGATEAGATVSMGGRSIRLRSDGSFSCRFALPDGIYRLPVVAVSADGTEGRAAELHFMGPRVGLPSCISAAGRTVKGKWGFTRRIRRCPGRSLATIEESP